MKKSAIVILIVALAICGLIGLFVFRRGSPPKPHSVTLNWRPPASGHGTPAATYNVYRGPTSNGPYVKIATGLSRPQYEDFLVNGSRTYFYVVTSVDEAGKESRYSEEIRVAIP